MHPVDEQMSRLRQLDIDIRDELVRHERRMEHLRERRATVTRQALEAAG